MLEVSGHVLDMPCDNVNDRGLALQYTLDQQQATLHNRGPESLKNTCPDHDVNVAGFIFQREEQDA